MRNPFSSSGLLQLFPNDELPWNQTGDLERCPHYGDEPCPDPTSRTISEILLRNLGGNVSWRRCWLKTGENGGELKINQAKASVRRPVSDIAHVGILVADTERLKLHKQLPGPLRVQ